MRGDIELMGGPPSPPTRENPATFFLVIVYSKLVKYPWKV